MSDLISRKAAIDTIEEYADRLQMVNWKENPGVPYKAYALNWCINTIRDLPSAEPEPSQAARDIATIIENEQDMRVISERKTGRWIRTNKDSIFASHIYKCSVCGNILDMRGVNAGRGDANYCPNCGAKMTEG